MSCEKLGEIYFITNESRNRIKIGFTSQSIDKRMKQLSTGSSEKLILLYSIEGTLDTERGLHNYFGQDYHKHLEWYDYEFVSNWIRRDKLTRQTLIDEGIMLEN